MDKMDPHRLNPEFRVPEMHGLMVPYLDLLAQTQHILEEWKRRGAKGTTFLDMVIIAHVFTFKGTRQQALVDYLDASRWTIRDSCDRCERNGQIVKVDGRYYPTDLVAEITNDEAGGIIAKIIRLCDATNAYRDALKQNGV
jgi:hypothetical protein